MEANPQLTPDPEQAEQVKRAVKREYASQYRTKQRELNRVTPEELPLFQADPRREEKLSLEQKSWKKFIVCRLCGFKAGRLTNHLKASHQKDLSSGVAGSELGSSPSSVQTHLRHTDIATTLGVYTQPIDASVRKLVNAVAVDVMSAENPEAVAVTTRVQ